MSPTKTPVKPPSLTDNYAIGLLRPTQCDQCGQFDSDPKVHDGVKTYHHDCTPMSVQASIIAGAHSQHPLMAANIFRQCRDGLRGADLRAMIMGQNMRDFGDAEMLKATVFANDVIDHMVQNGASGTFVVGPTTYTLPLKLIFMSTVSTAATQGTEWSTSGGYTAGGVSLAGLFTAAASAASKANTGAVTVTNAPAQTWADNEMKDSTGTPKRMLFKGTPSLAKTVNVGDTCTIAIGALTTSET